MKNMVVFFVGLFCLACLVGPQAVFGEASNEALEERVEKLESQLGSGEKEGGGILEKFSVGGVMAGSYQYQSVDDAPGFEDTGRGALVFQPEIGFALTERDELFVHFGFAAGNGLNDTTVSPFVLSPWAADLEDDVKNINGRSRDYLLQAWYKHTFEIAEGHTLGITGGLIDATGYLDENAYANDEYTQFMNAALVNGPNGFAPSYDLGGALEWELGPFAAKGVVMNVGENDNGRNYNFYGAQFGYTLETGMGEGNYRVIIEGASDDFDNPQGTQEESRGAVFLSFDQQLGDIFGAWVRFGWQDDKAAINFESLYSGGINLSGNIWGREQDDIGIGYAYLDGAGQVNRTYDKSQVFEVYARFLLNEYVAVTADVQYMDDTKTSPGTPKDSPNGFVSGLRMVVEF